MKFEAFRNFRKQPLAIKLRITIITTACAALLTAAFIEYTINARSTRHLMARDLLMQASLVAANSSAAVLFEDAPLADDLLGAFRDIDGIVAAATYTKDALMLGRYQRSVEEPQVDWPFPVRTSQKTFLYSDRYLDAVVPVRIDGEQIGTVFVRSTLENYYAVLLDRAVIIVIVAAGMCLLLLPVSFRLERRISAPILRLADTMKNLSQKHLYQHRVPKDTDDEVGTLIDSFNELLSEIHNRDTRLAAHREQIEHLAYFDNVTGLPNRSYMQQHLDFVLAAAKRHDRAAGLLFIDLDHFKDINDTLGHSAGDDLLRQVGERIKKALRVEDIVSTIGGQVEVFETGCSKFHSDVVGRIGGDEFVVTIGEITRAEDAAVAAQRVLTELAKPFDLFGQPRYIGASIGISVFPEDGDDAETLLKHADAAMYHAKSCGRNGFQFFIEAINSSAHERMALEHDLRNAVERGEFTVFYQPRIDLRSRELVSVEALVRWEHPERGLVPPNDFIAIAESNGLIVPIGAFVLREACRQIRAWHNAGLPQFGVSVNLSAAQFRHENLEGEITASLKEFGLDQRFLELEVTESMLMTDTQSGINVLEALRDRGVTSSIDDFGTGYSSLHRLRQLPVSALKIDRSFINELITNPDTEAIVHATISLAHSLRLRVIAEGVETQAQLARLYSFDCDEVQGYLFAKPLRAEALPGWLAEWQEKLYSTQSPATSQTGTWS